MSRQSMRLLPFFQKHYCQKILVTNFTKARVTYKAGNSISFSGFSAVNHLISQLNRPVRSMCSKRVEDLINDPKRHLKYDAFITLKKETPLLIIDVREPTELAETGVIPDSINIPLSQVENALGAMASETFHRSYGAVKPTEETPIVFSCRSGKRSIAALAKALSLGFENSSHYDGGWLDWEKHLTKDK